MVNIRNILIDINTKFNSKGIDKTKKSVNSLGARLKANEGHFQGWALSIMFAGMAILRVFTQVAKFGVKTFQEVMHSVEGTTTGFDLLTGQMKYLQYIAGAALEPLVAQLIPIIEAVSEWISENEELFASIVKWGIIIGGALMVVGQLVLGLQGIATAAMNVGTLLASPVGWMVLLAGLAFVGLMKVPDALDAVKTSIKNIDFQPLLDGFNDIYVAIFGATFSWEDFAWRLAWAIDKSVPFLNAIINLISMIATGIASTILQFKRLDAWLTKADDKEKARLKKQVLANKAKFEAQARDFGSNISIGANGFSESLPDFKERMNLLAKVDSIADKPKTASDVAVGALTGNGSTFQIGSITIQTDELAKLRSEIEDVSRGAPYKS